MIAARPVATPRLSLTASAARLAKGHRYLVVVWSARTKALVGSGLGTVG
ncbi:MAG: hypothetical protein AVDCRST_MAG79-136 [uncultured Thermoleophilia bacterium]|uniref:Uncharacterized protein n=1 Tax=uncultured Thermoleophilia bacterium TaxID=1497501 RepID=A0A6J4TDM7_9ACTN|nr:MAG: hypothetical protein AVDCRST_MAG79-136 [uncultured Thermoleophilia bacterium]